MHLHHDELYHSASRAFRIGIALNILFVGIEAGFGFWSGSLALLADAGHNLSDVLGLVVAWAAAWLAKKPPTPRRTYGWTNVTIYAAMFNGFFLLVVVGGIGWEALGRFNHPIEIPGLTVIVVALVGVVINTLTAALFFRDQHHDLNIRGAFLHMAADALVSLGVVVSGILIWWQGWLWIDPVTSLLIAVVIFASAWGLFRESLRLALNVIPAKIDPDSVRDYLRSLPGVSAVHDLHIWALATDRTALTAHLVKPDDQGGNDALLNQIATELHEQFGIDHVTIQIEQSSQMGCQQAPADRI